MILSIITQKSKAQHGRKVIKVTYGKQYYFELYKIEASEFPI